MNLLKVVMISFSLAGCATGLHLPQLLGPAEEVHCTLDRVGGAMLGEYACEIKGKYQMNEIGL